MSQKLFIKKMDKIQKALTKAYEIHKDQTRKGKKGYPYFVHILDVCKYLMYETKDEDVIVAGILHDTMEDSTYTEEELKKDFGEKVHQLVMFCTEPGNNPDNTPEEQKKSWRKRKEHSIEALKYAREEELLVFLADKLANILSIKEDIIAEGDIWSRFNASKEDILWYYDSINYIIVITALRGKRISQVFDELVTSMKNISKELILKKVGHSMTWSSLMENTDKEILREEFSKELDKLPTSILDEIHNCTISENTLTYFSGELNLDTGEVFLFLKEMKEPKIYDAINPDMKGKKAIIIVRRKDMIEEEELLLKYEDIFDDFIIGMKKGEEKEIIITD
jgi:hypothetical protein